jgi:hypothetical protein
MHVGWDEIVNDIDCSWQFEWGVGIDRVKEENQG